MSLTKKDIWLRSRSGRFELKFPVGAANDAQRVIAQTRSRTTQESARNSVFRRCAACAVSRIFGIFAFCHVMTTRLKYEKDGFHIDVDRADFGYDILEIELMVPSETM